MKFIRWLGRGVKAAYVAVSCILPFAILLVAMERAAEREPLPELTLMIILAASGLNTGLAIYLTVAGGSPSKLLRWLFLPAGERRFPGLVYITALALFAVVYTWFFLLSPFARPVAEVLTAIFLAVIIVGIRVLWWASLWALALRVYHKIWGEPKNRT